MPIYDDFRTSLGSRWRQQIVGSGSLETGAQGLWLATEQTSAQAYTNAQLDDYQGLTRKCFPWHAPLTLELRARFSHASGELRGTGGFGFWNDPFFFTGRRLPALPRAVWFFYASPPANMRLDMLAPGYGWKAATIDATRPGFLALAPTAPVALPLLQVPLLRQALWPIAQVALGVREALVTADMRAWHTYKLHWQRGAVRFLVDDVPVLESSMAPRGPLGFVLWLDNQYAVVTPEGRLGGGLLATSERQWLQVDWLRIALDE